MRDRAHQIVRSPLTLALLAALALTAAILGGNISTDEALWLYAGRAWDNYGIAPYAGYVDNKPPGIFLVYRLCHHWGGTNLLWPRAVGAAMLLLAALSAYGLARRLHSPQAGAMAMIMLGLSVAWSRFSGSASGQTESFTIGLSVPAFYLAALARDLAGRRRLAAVLGAGLCVGAATTFKATALFTACGLAIFDAALILERCGWRRLAGDLALLVAGVAAAQAAALMPVLWAGVGPGMYWREAWGVLLEPGTANPSLQGRLAGALETWQRSRIVMFYPLVLLVFVRWRSLRAEGVPVWGIMGWVLMDFVGVNASGYYFNHQLKQIVPSLAIAGAIGLADTMAAMARDESELRRNVLAACVGLILLWLPYEKFVVALTGAGLNDDARRIGLWVRDHTSPSDGLYVYGTRRSGLDRHAILAYSERECPTRYFFSMMLERQGALAEIERQLSARPPAMLLTPVDATPPQWLERILAGYRLEQDYRGWHVYRLATPTSGRASASS